MHIPVHRKFGLVPVQFHVNFYKHLYKSFYCQLQRLKTVTLDKFMSVLTEVCHVYMNLHNEYINI